MIPKLMTLLLVLALPAWAESVDFTLPDLQGRQVQLSSFQGKWVAVNFWATWCVPCLQEMPELDVFHERYKDADAMVIGVNFEDIDAAQLQAFVQEQFVSIGFPLVMSGANPLPGFTIRALPTTFLVSPAGKLVNTHMGVLTAAMLEELIEGFRDSAAGS